MKNDFSKLQLQQNQEEQTASLHGIQQHQQPHAFASVEEVIRTDKESVQVPPVVAERLNESIGQEPKPWASWWKRWFGRT